MRPVALHVQVCTPPLAPLLALACSGLTLERAAVLCLAESLHDIECCEQGKDMISLLLIPVSSKQAP
jgi:hypothetical protein